MSDDKKYNINDFWPEAEELLNQHFDDKKGGNKSAFWFIGLAFIIAIIGSTFLYLNLNERTINKEIQIERTASGENELIQNKSVKDNSIKTTNNLETITNTGDQNIQADIEGSVNSESPKSRNNSVVEENKNNSKADHSTNTSDKTASEKISGATNVGQIATQNKTKNTSNSAIKNGVSNFNTALKTLSKAAENLSQVSVNNTTTNNEIIAQLTDQTPFNDSNKIDNSELNNQTSASIKSDGSQISKTLATSTEITTTETQTKVDSTITNQETPLISKEKKEGKLDSTKQEKRVNFGLYAGLGLFNTAKTLSVNAENEAYKSRRSNEESANLNTSFSLGFQVKYNKLIIKSGIELNKYGETINYSDWLNAQQNTIVSKWSQFTDSASYISYNYLLGNEYQGNETTYFQDSIQSFDTTTSIEKTTIDLSSYRGRNSISYIEIPLSFSYILYQKQRMSLGISAGGSVGFLSQKTGYYIDETIQNTIDLESSNIIRKTVFNGRIGIQAIYSLNVHSAIFIEPQYRISLQSILNSPSGTTQKYRSTGLSLGYTYTF